VYFSIFKATLLLPRRPALGGTVRSLEALIMKRPSCGPFHDFDQDIGRVRQGKRGARSPTAMAVAGVA
jgi:hypothetical protein